MSLTLRPQANTLIVASTAASASAGAQPSTAAILGMLVTNLSTVDAYVSISNSSAATASVPTTAIPSTGSMPILQRGTLILNSPPNCWVSAITTAGQANLAFTPGFSQ